MEDTVGTFSHTPMFTFGANSTKCDALLSTTGQCPGSAHTQQGLPLRQKDCAQMVEASYPGLKSDTLGDLPRLLLELQIY